MEKSRIKILIIFIFFINLSVKALQEIKKPYKLQGTEVYKTPYISVLPAWINPKTRIEIIKNLQEGIEEKGVVKEIKLKGEWIKKLRCHPAVTLSVKNKKDNILLFIYPRSYRVFIEDPCLDVLPPIDYLGSTENLAFFCHPKNLLKNSMIILISNILELKR